MKSNVSAAGKFIRIAGVETLMDVPREAGKAEFLADIAAGARSGHRVQNQGRPEIQQEILDEVSAAVAGPLAVAVVTGAVEVVEAREVWDRTRILGASGSRA